MHRVAMKGTSLRRVAAQMMGLALSGVVLGLGVNAARPKGLPLRPSAFDYQFLCGNEASLREDRLLRPDEAVALARTPDAVLLDIRPKEAYDRGHLPGARHVAYSSVLPTDQALLQELARHRLLMIVDEADMVARAKEFAEELVRAGAKDVRVVAPHGAPHKETTP